MENKRPVNRLGIGGWFWAGKYNFERYLYILHRISGLALVLYFTLHILVTSSRIFGLETYEQVMGSLATPLFKFFEYLVFVAFVYHGLNGIRLIITELGFCLGKPKMPIFPYTNCIVKQRPLMWFLMVLVLIALVASGLDFFIL